ncbi:MAG: flagellar hook-basal body complex protein [Alphaproteobacteria bacterium]|nr:flagellar hook-basal body complex protein [Alphaproteobacteria bacterium]
MMSSSALGSALSALFANRTAIDYRAANIANAQTDGYKAVEARLSSYVTQGATGGVLATPVLSSAAQGAILQSAAATSFAVTGSGFLPVQDGTSGSGETLFTRRADFAPDENGFLRNGAGKVLYALPANGSGPLVPVQINRAALPAQPTANAVYAANLPANAPAGSVVNGGTVTITDAQGQAQSFSITWYNRSTPGGTLPGVPAGATTGTGGIPASAAGTIPQWRAVLTAQTGSANRPESLALDFSFGTTAGVDAGLPVSVNVQSTNPATLSAATTGGRVAIGYRAPGAAAAPLQQINVEFGAPAASGGASTLGAPGGLTSFGATGISISRSSADGYPSGTFVGAGIDSGGQVYASYTNGQRVAQYQVAVANFANAGGLVAGNGEAFRAADASGTPTIGSAAGGGIASNALEGSNVDLGTEITRSLVAQRAYSASARLVTTSDEMLKELLRVRR